jgi:hypothetical protein
MYIFFSLNYKDYYYSVGVRKLSEVDWVNLDFFHWKNTHDLIYTGGINVQMVKAFLAHKKQKANGNTSSQVQLRKYHDAIMWGSYSRGSSYYREATMMKSKSF